MKNLNLTVLIALAITLISFDSFSQGLHIDSGAHFIMTGPATLSISNGAFINDGVFSAGTNANSTLAFYGNASAAICNIGGANPVALQSLTLRKSTGDIQLNRDITLAAFVNMSGGNLQLNRHTLDLGATGNINGESEQSHIAGINAGRVTAKTTVAANTPFSPGTIGLRLVSNKAGTYQVTRQNTSEPLPNGAGKSILRNFSISGTAGATLSYTMKYLDAELNGNVEQNLIFYSTDRFGNALTADGRTSLDAVNDLIVLNDTTFFGHITVGPGVAATLTKSAITARASINIYPNPAYDQVTIELVSPDGGEHTIGLYDLPGHLIQQKRISCAVGQNRITWDISRLNAGIYYLSMGGRVSYVLTKK